MESARGIDIGRVISWGLDALGRNALAILVLAILLVGLPSFAAQYWTMSLAMSGSVAIGSALFWITNLLSGLAVPLVTDALLVGFVAHILLIGLDGGRAGTGRALVAALKMAVPLAALSLLIGLAVAIGLLLLIVPGVILSLVLIVAVPVMAVERTGVIQSMVRSSALTAGSKGMIFLLFVLLFLFSVLLAYLAEWLAPIAMELAGPGVAASALTGAATDVIRSTVSAAIVCSLYLELRAAKEGPGDAVLTEVFE